MDPSTTCSPFKNLFSCYWQFSTFCSLFSSKISYLAKNKIKYTLRITNVITVTGITIDLKLLSGPVLIWSLSMTTGVSAPIYILSAFICIRADAMDSRHIYSTKELLGWWTSVAFSTIPHVAVHLLVSRPHIWDCADPANLLLTAHIDEPSWRSWITRSTWVGCRYRLALPAVTRTQTKSKNRENQSGGMSTVVCSHRLSSHSLFGVFLLLPLQCTCYHQSRWNGFIMVYASEQQHLDYPKDSWRSFSHQKYPLYYNICTIYYK